MTILFSFIVLAKEPYLILSGDWAPYTGKDLRNFGIANEIVAKAMKSVGEEVEFRFVPWVRSLDLVLSNKKYIASSAWGYSDERAKFYLFSEFFINNPESFFYIKGRDKELNWSTLKDLTKVKASFGATRSYLHTKILEEVGLELDIANSDILNFKKLLAGRIQYFPCNPTVGLEILKKHFPEKAQLFGYTKKSLMNVPLGLVVDKKHPKAKDFISKFNSGLKLIKANGQLDKIFEQHYKERDLIELYYLRSASTDNTTNSSNYP